MGHITLTWSELWTQEKHLSCIARSAATNSSSSGVFSELLADCTCPVYLQDPT